jgi:hypothetical protein
MHQKPALRLATVAAAALFASATAFAGGGEALDIEGPSMRTPIAPAAQVMPAEEVALAAQSAYAASAFGGALTREQVREQLKAARADGTLSMHGEAGDTPRVLAARERANAEQRNAIVAEYEAEHQRQVAMAEAELRRADIEQQGLMAAAYGLGEGEVLMSAEGGAAIEGSGLDAASGLDDEPTVRVDVIDLQTSATAWPDELVIVSVEGGEPHEQLERAMHVRREYGEMGLSQSRIYVEGKDA